MQQPFHALSNTYYRSMEPFSSAQPAQHQPSSGHLIELSIVGNMSLVQYWTTPAAVISPEAKPRK